ncbi:hypothetical protein INR49_018937 [Caranx melampygus]|nr:hypothetical protein INR49_018937 [Caranx melampygus]
MSTSGSDVPGLGSLCSLVQSNYCNGCSPVQWRGRAGSVQRQWEQGVRAAIPTHRSPERRRQTSTY